MKVSGAGSGQAASGGARRVGKSDGSKGQFRQALVDALDGGGDVAAAEGATSIGGIDAVLVAQAVAEVNDREARRRQVRRADDILDKLEELRHGLLLGVVPEAVLTQLTAMVQNRREHCPDPRLAALLDEIELRAEVEIAKLARRR